MRSFLGAVNYFRGYIPRMSDIAYPLTELTRTAAKMKFALNDIERQAFQKLKLAVCEATALQSPQYSAPFIIHTDASNVACGASLSQLDEGTGKARPIAFVSQKFSKTQQNWSTIERETYALIYALKQFDYFIFLTPFDITCYCDHNPLSYLTQAAAKSPKLLRWSLSLSRYPLIIKHIKGVENEMAHLLSRSYVE